MRETEFRRKGEERMNIKEEIDYIIKLIEDAKTIDDGKVAFALIELYNLKNKLYAKEEKEE